MMKKMIACCVLIGASCIAFSQAHKGVIGQALLPQKSGAHYLEEYNLDVQQIQWPGQKKNPECMLPLVRKMYCTSEPKYLL